MRLANGGARVSLQKVACSRWSRHLLLDGCRRCTGSQVTHCRTSDRAALSHATRAAGAPAQAFPWTAKVKIQVRWGASAGRIGLRAAQAGRRTSVWCKVLLLVLLQSSRWPVTGSSVLTQPISNQFPIQIYHHHFCLARR